MLFWTRGVGEDNTEATFVSEELGCGVENKSVLFVPEGLNERGHAIYCLVAPRTANRYYHPVPAGQHLFGATQPN
jgi:hypothetical protein